MTAEEPRVKHKGIDERQLAAAVGGDALREVAERYGCGPIRFSGTADALYERHLTFDDVVPVAAPTPPAPVAPPILDVSTPDGQWDSPARVAAM
jgi:hypothetical protein